MTVTIAGVAFDGAEGTPRPRPSAAVISAYTANAAAYRWDGQCPVDEGSISAWLRCDRDEGEAALQTLQAAVNSTVSVAYAHGTIAGLTLAGVDGRWQAMGKSIAAKAGVLVVRLAFGQTDQSGSGSPSDLSSAKVQTASALAGPWTDQDWVCMEGSDGLGTYLGESEAWEDGAGPDASLLGKWARVVDRATGLIIYLHGIVVGVTTASREVNGAAAPCRSLYRIAGVGHALDQLYFPTWYEEKRAGEPFAAQSLPGEWANIGTPLDFNAGGKPDMGGSVTIDGKTFKLHARDGATGRWTASEALKTVLGMVNHLFGFDITLSAGAIDLTYDDPFPNRGLSVLGIISAILTPDRDRTFALEVSAGVLVLRVIDLAAAGTTVDLTAATVAGWQADLDAAHTADRVFYLGGDFTFLRTIRYNNESATTQALDDGWDSTQETDWLAVLAGTLQAQEREQGQLSAVFRRLLIQPEWKSGSFTGLGTDRIPCLRSVNANGEETGALEETAAADDMPQARTAWRLERQLPLSTSKDWEDVYTKRKAMDDEEGPTVFWYGPTSTPVLIPVHFDMQITVGDDGGSLIIGRDGDDAAAVKAKLDAGYDLLATVGLTHPFPVRASALGTADGYTEPRTDLPRLGWYETRGDDYSQTWIMPNTIWKLNAAGTDWVLAGPDPQPADPWRVDEAGNIEDVAARLRRFHLTPDGSLTWRVLGLGTITPAIGTIVADADARPTPGGTPFTIALHNIPIMRRSFVFERGRESVSWTANRIIPGLVRPTLIAQNKGALAFTRTKYEAEEKRRRR